MPIACAGSPGEIGGGLSVEDPAAPVCLLDRSETASGNAFRPGLAIRVLAKMILCLAHPG